MMIVAAGRRSVKARPQTREEHLMEHDLTPPDDDFDDYEDMGFEEYLYEQNDPFFSAFSEVVVAIEAEQPTGDALYDQVSDDLDLGLDGPLDWFIEVEARYQEHDQAPAMEQAVALLRDALDAVIEERYGEARTLLRQACDHLNQAEDLIRQAAKDALTGITVHRMLYDLEGHYKVYELVKKSGERHLLLASNPDAAASIFRDELYEGQEFLLRQTGDHDFSLRVARQEWRMKERDFSFGWIY